VARTYLKFLARKTGTSRNLALFYLFACISNRFGGTGSDAARNEGSIRCSPDGCWFRGACVALVAASKAEATAQDVIVRYRRSGYTGRILVPEVS